MAEAAEQSLRRTAREIFEHVENNAHEELRRSTQALASSGFAGGLSMGLTGLGVAAALAAFDGVKQISRELASGRINILGGPRRNSPLGSGKKWHTGSGHPSRWRR